MPEEIEEKEKMTSGEILKIVSYVILCIAVFVGSFVIRGNRDRIVALENHDKLEDTVIETVKVLKNTTDIIKKDIYNTDQIIKLRKDLDKLINERNAEENRKEELSKNLIKKIEKRKE